MAPQPGIKGLLLLLQYIFLGAVIFLGLFLITSLAHGLRLSDSGKDYLDSTAFANTLYDAAYGRDVRNFCYISLY